MRAIVVGAGIGGLSAGIGLQRAGLDVTVFERMRELREVGSGLTLWTNAMRALGKLGVADPIRSRGAVVESLENWAWYGKQLGPALPLKQVGDKFGTQGYGIHRGELQAGLAAALKPGTLQLGVQCTGFSQDKDGVTVRFGEGREERADFLVGADGIKSVVRAGLFGEGKMRYSGYTCWRSAVKLDHPALRPTVYLQLYGPGANFGIFPIGQGRWSWYGTNVTPAGQSTGKSPDWKREATDRFKKWWEPVRAVIAATDENAFARQDIYDLEPINQWSKGRVTLLGDAAHATTPALGQGGCMAIEDAVVLTRNVTQNSDTEAALRQYAAERMGRANGIVRQARRHGNFYHASNPIMRVAREAFFRFAPVSVAMKEVEKLMGYEAK
jgi:2-polyprenyl-6-methoxyphenol hydroxylase-like FAD-dependent oxidoreductase